MKSRSILAALLILLTTSLIAQVQPTGNLTIFSEDGDKFFLFLNGEQINDKAQVNIRVEDLNQPYYNAKITFEDPAKEPLTKSHLQITDPADGVYMDVTYKMKRDKNNALKSKLNFFSVIPVEQNYAPPSGMYVRHWGRPETQQVVIVQPANSSGTVTQTTTTTTTSNGTNAAIGVTIDGVGIGMNVNMNDGMSGANSTVSQTTTTTTSGNRNVTGEPIQEGCSRNRPMTTDNFSNALATLKKIGFDETRLSTAKQVAKSNCLSTAQIVQISELFSFEDSKLDFAKFAYDHCTDPKNYFNVNNIFSFSSSTESLTNYVNGKTIR
jgi:hypothetical protein